MGNFLQSATGDPVLTKRRSARQSARMVPPGESAFKDFRNNGGPIAITSAEIVRQNISAGGAPQPKLTGKRGGNTGSMAFGDLDPVNLGQLHMFANVMKKYAYTDNTTWQKWQFDLSQATSADAYVALLNDNDVTPRMRFRDVLYGGFQLGAQPNGNLSLTAPFVYGELDLHGASTQTAGTSSDTYHLRGTWDQQWAADATDKDLYIKRISKSGSVWSMKAKIGSGSAYSSGFSVTEGLDSAGNPIYTNVLDETGALIGTWAEPVKIHIPASAVGTDNDIWKFPKRRASWSQSLDAERAISSVESIFFIDGEEVRIDGGFAYNFAWARNEALPQVSGRQGATVDRGGDLMVTLTPTRRITDLRLQKAIFLGSTVSAVLDSRTSSNISGASRPYRGVLMLPAVKLFAEMFDTAVGGQNKDEAPVGQAGLPTSTFTYTDSVLGSLTTDSHASLVLENDVTTSEW